MVALGLSNLRNPLKRRNQCQLLISLFNRIILKQYLITFFIKLILIMPASNYPTNHKVLSEILTLIQTKPLRIVDIGCGNGNLLNKIAQEMIKMGHNPRDYLLGIDIIDQNGHTDFAYIKADLNNEDQLLDEALKDFSPDIILCIEVLEHLYHPRKLLFTISGSLDTKKTIGFFSVPNIGHMKSRLSFLLTGKFDLYYGPSERRSLIGTLSGHINPFPINYWLHAFNIANLEINEIFIDRKKKGAILANLLLKPITFISFYKTKLSSHRESLNRRYTKRDIYGISKINDKNIILARTLIFKVSN